MTSRDGFTLPEVLVALTVGSLLMVIGVYVLVTVINIEGGVRERQMLEDHLQVALRKIGDDAAESYGVGDGIDLRPGDQSFPKQTLFLLQNRKKGEKMAYFGDNVLTMVEYGLKLDEHPKQKGMPRSRFILYRAEHRQVRTTANPKEPVALYLNRNEGEKVPGFRVRGLNSRGEETDRVGEITAIEVTVSGTLQNGQIITKQRMVPLKGRKEALA